MYFWLWIGVLIGSVLLEVLTASALICIWFAPGALVGLLTNQLNLSFTVQIILFFTASILSFVIIRPMAKEYLRGNVIATNADRVIGKRTRLIKAYHDGDYGEVRINGMIWNVISKDGKDIDEGKLIEILAIDGTKLIVRKIMED